MITLFFQELCVNLRLHVLVCIAGVFDVIDHFIAKNHVLKITLH